MIDSSKNHVSINYLKNLGQEVFGKVAALRKVSLRNFTKLLKKANVAEYLFE